MYTVPFEAKERSGVAAERLLEEDERMGKWAARNNPPTKSTHKNSLNFFDALLCLSTTEAGVSLFFLWYKPRGVLDAGPD